MKKLFTIKAIGILTTVAVLFSSCQAPKAEDKTLTVGATSVPHAEILNQVVDDLKNEGITLVVKEYSDYTLLNPSTVDGSIDANFFQHIPYLEDFNKNAGSELVSVGPIHLEPLGIYTKAVTSLDEIPENSKVSIPNDGSNEYRALKLLEANGLITLEQIEGTDITPNNIVDNPKNLEFLELDAAQLPRTLDEVAISVINTNYALEASLDPSKDALASESPENNPYANCLVVNKGKENDEAIQKLYKALTSDKTKKFIEDKYKGAVIPAF